MAHANARLTPAGRMILCRRIAAGRPVAQVAAEMGISRTCAYRWWTRYRQHGPAGLVDRPSWAHRHPRRTPPPVEAQVLELRQSRKLGPARIAPLVGLAASTVYRVLCRHRLNRLAWMDRPTGQPIRRYERAHPGELVHMDVKKLGRIPPGGGWRVHGRQMGRSAERRRAVVGFDYVHSLVDDHSRLAYSEILPDEKGASCAGFLARAIDYFAAHGITRIERLMTDNAWAYRYSLRELCALRGIRQVFIKPHCPWQNGKVERLNRTLQTEWAYRQVFLSNDERAAALAPWLEYYNTRRRHSALGGLPPISRL
jgi:transposase InsO family protein